MASTYAREKPSSPTPPQRLRWRRYEWKRQPPWHWFVCDVTPSLARRQLAAEQIRELGSQRGASCEGGEHNQGEGREMTRAFTVMRFPL